jgi:hypothetical protein
VRCIPPSGRWISPQTKSGRDVRGKTTMVHGHDKTSPLTTTFVSRLAWRVCAMVLVCLLACPSHRDKAETDRKEASAKSGMTEGGVQNSDPTHRPRFRIPRARLLPDFHSPRVPLEEAAGKRALGEALSQTTPGGPRTPGVVCSEAKHRSARPRGNPPPVGLCALPAARAIGRIPSDVPGVSPAFRFS